MDKKFLTTDLYLTYYGQIHLSKLIKKVINSLKEVLDTSLDKISLNNFVNTTVLNSFADLTNWRWRATDGSLIKNYVQYGLPQIIVTELEMLRPF